MRTEAQILASRVNGAKSRGPVTPDGKRRSANNALRHGCRAATPELAQIPCARSQEQEQQAAERHNALLTSLRNIWKPATPDLESLVEQLATIRARITRLHQCEEDILNFAGIRQRTGGPRTNEELERTALTLRSLQSLLRHDAQLNHARAAIEAQLRDAREAGACRRIAQSRTNEPATEPGKPVATVSAAGTNEPASEPNPRPATPSSAGTIKPTPQPATAIKTNNIRHESEPGAQPRRPTYGPDGRRIRYPDLAA